jgi:hypothetical protein
MATPKHLLVIVPVLLTILGLLSWGVWADDKEVAPTAPDVRTVPHDRLQPGDAILAADLSVSDDRTLHVVWNEAIQKTPGTLPDHVTLYTRSKDGGNTWSEPTVIDRSSGSPQITASGRQLDIITGPRLEHFGSEDGGESWSDLGPVLPDNIKGEVVCDLANTATSPALACLVHPKTPYERSERGEEHAQRLLFGYLSKRGEAKFSTISTFTPSMSAPPSPRLVVAGGVLHILAGVNEDQWQQIPGGGDTPALKTQGEMYAIHSSDNGHTWSNATTLSGDNDHFDAVESVEGLAVEGKVYAFFSAHGIFGTRSVDGKEWSGIRHISPYQAETSPVGVDSALISAAVDPARKGAVVWIDERYRKSTGHWWNPLGGFPWSDDTQQLRNNDVFSLTLSQVDDLLLHGKQPNPIRITPPMGFARLVRLRWVGNQFLILWVGRQEVGKQLDSNGFPPELFYSFFGVAEDSSETTRHAQ